MQVERDVARFLTLVIFAAVIADVLTHGSVAVSIGKIIGGILNNFALIAAGQGSRVSGSKVG